MIYYADVFKTLNLYGWIFYIFWSLECKSSWLCWFSWLFYCLPVTGLADVGLDWHDIWCRYPWSPEEESHWLVVILWRFMASPHQVSISLCPTLWFRCRPKGSLSCILWFHAREHAHQYDETRWKQKLLVQFWAILHIYFYLCASCCI